MRLVDGRSGVEVMDRATCLERLAEGSLGRIAALSGGRPICLPVNYVVDEDRIVFRTARGTTFDAAVRGAPVAFEIDDTDPEAHTGWSVVVSGIAKEILHPDEVARLEKLPLQPWVPGDMHHWVAIQIESVSGRRVRPSTSP
jgi:nitroimidazol reductase NimA-like FMN-containing flavoprotein (pyridoxamine 5'-phosphate oxidase superfamily)